MLSELARDLHAHLEALARPAQVALHIADPLVAELARGAEHPEVALVL